MEYETSSKGYSDKESSNALFYREQVTSGFLAILYIFYFSLICFFSWVSKGGELHLINVLERLLDVHDSKINLQLLWFTLLYHTTVYDTKLVIVDTSSQREVLRLRLELVDNSGWKPFLRLALAMLACMQTCSMINFFSCSQGTTKKIADVCS